jgi:DNA-directed RNA polymerase subunit E'/Rpb7
MEDDNSSMIQTEEDKEFQIREKVRIRMEAQIQEELRKIKEKVGSKEFNFQGLSLIAY